MTTPSAIASGPTVPDPTTLADARALVAKYGLAVDDAVRAALDDARERELQARRSRLCARAFRTDRAAEGFARRRDQAGQGRRLRDHRSRRRPRGRGPRRRRRPRATGAAGARRGQARWRSSPAANSPSPCAATGRGGPNQEYALALAGLLKDTPDISALAADTDGADGGAGSATDPAGAMIDARHVREDEVARPRRPGLSRQQRRHRLLHRDRRSRC